MSHTKLSFSRQGQKVVQIKSDQNHVNFSSLSDFSIKEKKHLGIGIKYVTQGQETYLVDGQRFLVSRLVSCVAFSSTTASFPVKRRSSASVNLPGAM